VVKKTPLSAYSRPRPSGIIAVDLRDGDQLVGVALTDGQRDILLCTSVGKAIRFNESEVRPMGRDATGVRGIRLGEATSGDDPGETGVIPIANGHGANGSGPAVISLVVVAEGHILTASENGYGKLTPIADFPIHGRGGQGVIALQTTERNGATVAALQVTPDQEIMLISSTGTLVRTPVADISVVGRNTQGVRLIRLADGERLTGVERLEKLAGDENDDSQGDTPSE
jgi:DNA gyrase subunit A